MTTRTIGFGTLAVLIGIFSAGLLSGCTTHTTKADQSASNFLGINAVNVLSDPTKVEGWNYRAPDGTSYTEPMPRLLDLSVATELRDVLFDENTYAKPGFGSYERSVGFRIYSSAKSVDVIISFTNDSITVKSPGPSGAMVTQTGSCANAHDKLLKLAKRVFAGQDVR